MFLRKVLDEKCELKLFRDLECDEEKKDESQSENRRNTSSQPKRLP